MKHLRRYMAETILGCMVAIMLFASPMMPVRAEGTTTIAVSKSSLQVGDTLTVTVQPSESGSLQLKYNAGVLQMTGCNASGYTTGSNTVSYTGGTAKVTFKAIAEGESSLVVSSPDGQLTGSSTKIQVTTAATDTPASPATPATPSEPTTPSAPAASTDGQFTIDGVAYVVSERYRSSEIPAGFSKVELTISNGTYKELTNGQMTLVYLKPASNISGSGTFFIYDEAAQTVSPMKLIGSLQDYVIVLIPEEIPELLTQTEISIGNMSVTAYTASGEETDATADFYYIYGMDETGTTQWFSYDSADGSMQRANMGLFEVEEEDEPTVLPGADQSEAKEHLSRMRFVIAILIFAIAVLVIAVFNLLLSRKHQEEDLDDFLEEDTDYDTDDASVADDAEDAEEKNKDYAGEDTGDDAFYAKDTPEIKAMFSDAADVARDEETYDQEYDQEEEYDDEEDGEAFDKKDSDEDFPGLEILDLNDL